LAEEVTVRDIRDRERLQQMADALVENGDYRLARRLEPQAEYHPADELLSLSLLSLMRRRPASIPIATVSSNSASAYSNTVGTADASIRFSVHGSGSKIPA
jgi:hypothetical protein